MRQERSGGFRLCLVPCAVSFNLPSFFPLLAEVWTLEIVMCEIVEYLFLPVELFKHLPGEVTANGFYDVPVITMFDKFLAEHAHEQGSHDPTQARNAYQEGTGSPIFQQRHVFTEAQAHAGAWRVKSPACGAICLADLGVQVSNRLLVRDECVHLHRRKF